MDYQNPPSADWTIPQGWESYTAQDHQTWLTLYDRQAAILPGRACQAYLDGLAALDLRGAGIPEFQALSEKLMALTGWQVVAVPGLVPEDVFFRPSRQSPFSVRQFHPPSRSAGLPAGAGYFS